MTDDWDFYFGSVEDRPASFFVDLGAQASAPVKDLPFMAYLRLSMREPRADGLSSEQEYEAFAGIEDRLENALIRPDVAYLGRCTTNGCRDFFFYTSAPESWTTQVAAAMRSFPDYEYEADSRYDPAWSTYFEYLYPREPDRQRIENRRVCDALQRHGDRLDQRREIDHWAYFGHRKDRDAFVADAVALGFAVRALTEAKAGDERFGAQIWRFDLPSFEGIDEITLPLYHLAVKHRGEYDGWECVVVA